MPEDFIRQRGYLTLGSRLKRLGERMQADVHRLARAEGVNVPPGLLPILGVLDRHEALTVGGLAEALGVAQPGITRNLAQLAALGLVKSARPAGDLRQRSVSLTPKGASLVARTKHDMWPRVERAVVEICAGLPKPILEQLSAIEDALAEMPLDRRAARPRKGKSHATDT
jgi:DNA-binding MarR family transcriptional regulator